MSRKLLFILALIGIIFLIYSISLDNPFYWDDEGLIVNNYSLRTPLNFKNYFVSNPIPQRPLVTLSFAIDYSIFGLNPFGYHLTQIIIHIFNTLLVFYIAHLIFKDKWVSVLSGAVFAFHPIHTEAVSLFLGRSDLLCSLFFLISFLFYIKFSYSTGDIKKLFYYFSLIAFSLSLLSKEMAIILPFVIVVYDKLIIKSIPEGISHRYAHYIPYFLLSICYFIFWYLILHGSVERMGNAPVFKFWGGSIYSTLLTQMVIFKKYIKLLFIPVGMSGWYETPVYKSILNSEVFFSIIFLASLLFICFYKLSRQFLFTVLWFFITILPISNLIPIPGSMIAERWLYIPSVGYGFFLASTMSNLIDGKGLRLHNFNKKFILFITAILFMLYCTLSFVRNLDFNDELTFFKNLYNKNSSSQLIRNNLGLAYLRKNNPDEAIKILEPLAKEMKSPFLQLIFNNLGGAYEKKRDIRMAEKLYKAAIKIKPDYADAHLNLGSLYLNLGRTKEAEEEFKEVIRIDTFNPNAHYNLGLLYFMEGKYNDAIKEYNESIKMRPDLPDVHSNLGLVYYRKGLLELAAIECIKALELDHNYFQAYGNLGLIYLEQGKKDLALKNFKKVLELDPKSILARKYIEEIYKIKNQK